MIEFGTDEDGFRTAYDPAKLHTVVAGRTRSGKSVLVYGLLKRISETPWVKVVGVDPSGILLGPMSSGKECDFALGTSPAALAHAIELLQSLEKLMDERIGSLMRLGIDQVPPNIYSDPRIGSVVLVLEEYAGLLAACDKKQGEEIRRITGRVLREGSKSAVHCLTIIQRPEANLLHDRAQYARAIVMAVENADSVRMLLPMAEPEEISRLVSAEPGRGYLMEAGAPLRFFRGDYIDYETYAAAVKAAAAGKSSVFAPRQGEQSEPRQPN